jgi:hypothetical protein
MTRFHRFILGGAVVVLVATVVFFSCVPSRQIRSDALATAAKQAILDTDREYATALNYQPAYYGYVLRGDFDFQDVVARIGKIGPSILGENQVHAVDWRKEQGGGGFGPQYVYRRTYSLTRWPEQRWRATRVESVRNVY